MAAVLAGKFFHVPVVLSARGTDINLYTKLFVIKRLIQFALRSADRCVAVSADLKKTMVFLGIEESKINVIPNGIDPERFYKIDKFQAREYLGLSLKGKILLSVGALIEIKGHHLLIEALAKLRQGDRLTFKTYIVGQGEWYDKLASLVNNYGLQEYVFLQGGVANRELVFWYNAADLFFLGSSREGWPNVVMESLACGTPVLATAVNGIPEIISRAELGTIMANRSVDCFCREIPKALARSWDHMKIYQFGQSRTWDMVAQEVCHLFTGLMKSDNVFAGGMDVF